MQTRQEITTPLTLNAWHSCYDALRTLFSKETFAQEYLEQLESIKSGIEETLRNETQATFIQGHVFTPEIESLLKLYDTLIKQTEAVELNDLSRLIQTFLKNNPRLLEKINPNDIRNGTYIIPFGVTTIDIFAFSDCIALTSIRIPASVTSIAYSAFYNCTALTTIRIPASVTSIGQFAFYNCTALTSITIPANVTSIAKSVFCDCTALTSISIPASVISIGYSAFYNCTALTTIRIPASVTSIDGYAFYNCTALTTISIPASVASIGESAFRGCTSLASITIPNSVASIGESAFSGCTSLTTLRIPASVTSIGRDTFSGCTSLTTITIPTSVISIGQDTFSGCVALTTIIIDANNQQRYDEILRMLPPNLRAIAKDLGAFKERFVTTIVNERKGHGFFASRRVPGEVTGIILAALSKTYDLPPLDERATGRCVNDNITASLVP